MTPLRLATVELPDFHPEAPGSDTIHGFVVRDGRDCILVDTGVGSGSRLIDRLYKPDRVDLAVALGRLGLQVDQITAIVNSHLHFDHCGNNSLFPGVPIIRAARGARGCARARLHGARVGGLSQRGVRTRPRPAFDLRNTRAGPHSWPHARTSLC